MVGCSLGDVFTDVLYVTVHPYASFQLWVAACVVLALPTIVFSLGSGLLFQVIGQGVPRMIVAATRFVPKERRAMDKEVCPLLCPKHTNCCLLRGACLPVSAVAAVLYLVLIKPVLCVVLLFLTPNLKLVVFPRLMSKLIDYLLHELPEEEASVQVGIMGVSPGMSSPSRRISSSASSSIDETEDVFRLNLAFLSAAVFGSMPQLGIMIANTYYLGQSSAASGFPEAVSGFPVLAAVSIFFSVLVTILHVGRMVYWINRYGWRMDLRMIMYPLKDTQVHRLQLVRNLYKASNSLVSAHWAQDSGRDNRIKRMVSGPQSATTSTGGGGNLRNHLAKAQTSGPRSYMAAVTVKHETSRPGWLSLEVGQVVNVLFENSAADEVFVKVLVDGRQGSFPMRCVTLNEDKGSETKRAEMPVGMPPEIELQPSSAKLVTGGKTVSATGVSVALDTRSHKSQLQLMRAAELQRTRTTGTSELKKSRAADEKYNERLTRARSTSSFGPVGSPGGREENSEIAACVESALRCSTSSERL